MTHERQSDHKKVRKPEKKGRAQSHSTSPTTESHGLASLQRRVGNQAVQRLLAQRSEQGPVKLDEKAGGRINQERSGGQSLPETTQKHMGAAMGRDLSDVRVHTSPEADALNRELGAKAFTTGQDIFFREGAYDPYSSDGQKLIGHELTHVVQQSAGEVNSGNGMTVSAPGDVHEQEADATAEAITGPGSAIQAQAEEEEELQMQADEELEEEELQMQADEELEEEELQMQADEELEEEELQMQTDEELEEEMSE